MPLTNYGVFKGRALDRKPGKGRSPHYEIHGLDDGAHFRVSVNVRSRFHPSELLYLVDEDFQHPITNDLSSLSLGFTRIRSRPGGLALDYIRGDLLNPEAMRALRHDVPGPDNDLNDKLDRIVCRAMASARAMIYAFGQRFGPLYRKKDRFFDFAPRNGIHDIHMNQGSHPIFQARDGVWQDGGLLFQFPRARLGRDRWVAVFLAFQSQAWHTDDATGRALVMKGEGGSQARVRIVAALVHPDRPPVRKNVLLLNTTPGEIDLTNWALSDIRKSVQPLAGTIGAGETRLIAVEGPVHLSQRGGIITLLDNRGVRVDGVSYTKAQGRKKGETIMF